MKGNLQATEDFPPSYGAIVAGGRRGSSVEVKKVTLTWDGINVYAPRKKKKMDKVEELSTDSVEKKDEEDTVTKVTLDAIDDLANYKHIVRDVSGIVEPGTLLAVMGSSGAGKTTLMNALTFRNKGDLVINGEIKLNGVKIDRTMSEITCYVQQDILFLPTITVMEQLWFHSQLRMEKNTPMEMRRIRVEEVMTEMGLHKCANVMVGSPGMKKGISGGEMKRLAFAAELLTNPPLMFLDEPMSGLDSYMAKTILVILREMASNGRSIVCTIHQPSSEMFQMFDKLLLVSEGRVAYLGPANEASEFFKSCGYPMPMDYNPAEHFVKVLAVEPGTELASKQRIEYVCDQFMSTKHHAMIREKIDDVNLVQDKSLLKLLDVKRSIYKASWLKQFYVILWRCSAKCIREPAVFWIKLVQMIIISLLFGVLFWQQKHNQEGVTSINGAIFYMQLQLSFLFGLHIVQELPLELPVFFKEHLDGMYRTDVYFISKALVEIPLFVVLPLAYTAIQYFMIGLYASASAFFITYACNLMICFATTSCGCLIGTLATNPKIAVPVMTLIITLIIVVGGYFIHPNAVPVYFVWLRAISWVSYSNEILVVNQWSNVDYIECNHMSGQNHSTNCFRSGKEIIEFYGYSENDIVFNFMIILVLIVCFRLLAFICLLIRSKKSYKMAKSH